MHVRVAIAVLGVQIYPTNYHLSLGAGKTWPCICLPQVLDILRDDFSYNFPHETRIIYIVPLVNIYYSLEAEMKKLKIPHQILSLKLLVRLNQIPK